jgi:hypothetical protein
LQAKTLTGFDRVIAVVQHAVQAAVDMRHVIAAIEIIIDEDFPVAVKRVTAALEPVQLFKVQAFKTVKEILAEKIFERWISGHELGEHPIVPDRSLYREKSGVGAVEILHAAEFRRENERALQIISPTMIGTAEIFCFSFGLSHYSGRAVTADVEETAHNVIAAPNRKNRFAGDLRREVMARLTELSSTTDELPRLRKDCFLL